MTDLTNLARAMKVRALSQDGDADVFGAALAVLRGDAMTGALDDQIDMDAARVTYDEIMALTVADMPPSTDLVRTLIETVSQREGGISAAMVWRSIGVNPNRGRDFMSRQAHAVDWPIWYTLREAALGGAPCEE